MKLHYCSTSNDSKLQVSDILVEPNLVTLEAA